MKTLLVLLGISLPLYAQIDLFTGQLQAPKTPPAAAPEVLEMPKEPAAAAPSILEVPAEPSLIIVLGENTMPPYAYPSNVRGFKGLIDWKQVPDLGYNKEEIRAVSIIQRQPQGQEGGALIYAPSMWHFKAENWEAVYNGAIPYLEDLMFLEDSLRVRLSTKLEVRARRSSEGYQIEEEKGGFGIYQAVNTPYAGAVSKIMVVKAEDNQNFSRMKAAFEAASDVPPIMRPPAMPALDTNAPALDLGQAGLGQKMLPAGVSIFDKL